MRNLIRYIAVLALAMAPAVHAEGFYVGAAFGTSSSDDYENYVLANWDDGSFTSATIEDSDTFTRFFVGYDLNENFAFELGLSDLGTVTTDAVSNGCCFYFPGPVHHEVSADGMEVSALAKLPLGESGGLFFRLGFFAWDITEAVSDSSGGAAFSDDGSDLYYGIGASYKFGESWALSGEYTLYSMEPSAGGSFDATSMSVSLSYAFGN